jgi:hypothetical protein
MYFSSYLKLKNLLIVYELYVLCFAIPMFAMLSGCLGLLTGSCLRIYHANSKILHLGLKKLANGEISTPLAKFFQQAPEEHAISEMFQTGNICFANSETVWKFGTFRHLQTTHRLSLSLLRFDYFGASLNHMISSLNFFIFKRKPSLLKQVSCNPRLLYLKRNGKVWEAHSFMQQHGILSVSLLIVNG